VFLKNIKNILNPLVDHDLNAKYSLFSAEIYPSSVEALLRVILPTTLTRYKGYITKWHPIPCTRGSQSGVCTAGGQQPDIHMNVTDYRFD
jgi:hypothetical protein